MRCSLLFITLINIDLFCRSPYKAQVSYQALISMHLALQWFPGGIPRWREEMVRQVYGWPATILTCYLLGKNE